MFKRFRHTGILILLLLATQMAAQVPVLDSICSGAERYYRVNGEEVSTYSWILTHPDNTTEVLPSTADTIQMFWNYLPGIYEFEVIQHSELGCDADPVFGYIIILESPDVFAGEDDLICNTDFYHLVNATAAFTSSVLWTTDGDGSFDNDTILHAAYTPGAADIFNGGVTLTLTGFGLGDESTCEPAVSDITLTIVSVLAEVSDIVHVTCFGGNDGAVQITALEGTPPYTYVVDGISNDTGWFENLFAGNYVYEVTDFNGCTFTGEFTITQPDAMTASYSFSPVTCYGAENGSITIFDAMGGSGAYEYSLDSLNWQDNGLFTGLAPGSYTAYIRDAEAVYCAAVVAENIIITEPDELSATLSYTNLSCNGNDDGTITVSDAVGGSGQYQYSINGGDWQDSGLFTGLAAGIYEVLIRDLEDEDCVVSLGSVEISEPGEPLAFAGDDDEVCSNTLSYQLSGYAENFTGLLWETNGNGTFDDPNVLNAIYTFGEEDILSGSVTLTLTAIAAGDCPNASDSMMLSITPAAIAFAGDDDAICEGDVYELLSATAQHYDSLLWLTTGDGTFNNASILNPIYTPGSVDIAAGTVDLSLIAYAMGICENDTATMTLAITGAAIADAGEDAEMCTSEASYTLNGQAENFSSIQWATSGDGAFDDATSLTAVYTPGLDDITTGSVVLTLTVEGNGTCPNASDSMILSITPAAIAFAGEDDAICEGDVYELLSATAQHYDSLLWLTTGDGTFNNASILNPIYTPGSVDIAAGTVDLSLIAYAMGVCENDTATITLAITGAAIADAGEDAEMCTSEASYALNGQAENFSSILWATSGDGAFDDATSLTAVYTPGLDDITTGSVVLTLTVEGNGTCPEASDSMILSIIQAPLAFAGEDASICEGDIYMVPDAWAENYDSVLWSHNGLGELTEANTLAPTYIPEIGETGVITLVLTAYSAGSGSCPDAVDSLTITIVDAPWVFAGEDGVICSADAITMSGESNMTAVLWTTGGTGTFDNPASLTATYTPGEEDIEAGQVILTLTAFGDGNCEDVSDEMVLTIWKEALAFAGEDVSICEGDSYQVSDAWALNYDSVYWTHNGLGILEDSTTLTPTYIPAADETGIITMVLTVVPEGPEVCPVVSDSMQITITGAPTVYAGEDAEICAGDSYEVSGESNMTFIIWSTSGDGFFEDSTALTTTYFPGSFDMANGQATLTLTAQGSGNCPDVSDSMILTIWMQATADAGSDAVICQGDTYQVYNAFATNYSSLLWTHDGAGTLSGENTINPIYTPAPDEYGIVTLVLTVYPEVTFCTPVTDTMTITIIGAPTVNAGEDANICEGDTYLLSGESNVINVLWTTSGTGTFDDPTVLAATYIPGAEDIDAGQVVLTLTAFGEGSCGDVSDEMVLSIWKEALAFAGEDAYICEGQSYQVNDAWALNYESVLWSHNGLGTLIGENTLSPVYEPASGELGVVALVITVTPSGQGACPDVTDTLNITIMNAPVADAGEDAEVCSNDTHLLSGSALNYTSVLWTSNGDGFFEDPGSLITYYTPGPDDIEQGIAVLTLTVTGSGNCGEASDSMTLTIRREAVADAGPDVTICEGQPFTITDATAMHYDSLFWTHDGVGVLSDTNTLHPTYTPGPGETGLVTLTLTVVPYGSGICPVAEANMVLTIMSAPMVAAGEDAEICETDTYTLAGWAENHASVLWESSGDGTFENEHSEITNYYPGESDILAGQVTLTLTAYGFGNCGEIADNMTLVIIRDVHAFAGNDTSICEDGVIQLNAFAEHYSELEWSTNGTGSFSDPTALNPVYTPGIEDIQAGTVILTLTAYSHGSEGTCPAAISEIIVTISSPHITNIATTPSLDNNPVGTAHVTVSGGTAPYMYSLDGVNWQHGPTFAGLLAGSYTAWVRDAIGCIDTKDFIILNLVLGEVEVIAGVINSCAHVEFDVPVMATGFMNIAMFNLKLDFDPAILQLHTLVDINPALLNGLLSFTQPNPGSVVIEFSSGIPTTIPSDENLFKLEFTGIEAGMSSLQWDRPECYFFAASGYAVPSIYITGLVEVHPIPAIAVEGEEAYCEGDMLTLKAQSFDQQNLNYYWIAPDGNVFEGQNLDLGFLSTRHSGNFILTAINAAGCDTTINIPVKVNQLPDVQLAVVDTLCIDSEPIWLEPGIWYTSYTWQDGSIGSSYLATEEGNYWVEVIDENGCKGLATLTLVPCHVEILMPNAFTPNGDGINDVFGPVRANVALNNYSMLIYNKWGNLIFETNNISEGWDGTVNGVLAPMDVYTYVIIYDTPGYMPQGGRKRIHGSVMLLR